jgi:NADP-dependent aldehyde dehydrogenase
LVSDCRLDGIGFTGIRAAGLKLKVSAGAETVPATRMPAALKNKNPNGRLWRLIDGNWSQGNVSA